MINNFPQLPSGWELSRVDRVATVNARIGWKALTADEYVDEGYVFLATPNIKNRNIDFENVNYVSEFRYEESPELKLQEGDVLLAKDGNTLGTVNVVRSLPRAATVNSSIALLRPNRIDPIYLYYALACTPVQETIQTVKDGMGVPHLFQRDIRKLPLPLPPVDEQRRIADFLDAETSRIDALLQARGKQRSALAECEVSVIARMLSGGASVDTGRPTGWPWLPHIPTNWSVGPVYAYYAVDLGKMLNKERSSGPNQKPYLRNANIHWYEIDISDVATMTFEPEEHHRYLLRPGDLLVCEGGAGIAEAAVWDGRIQECFYQKSLHRVRSISHLPPEWLMYWLKLAKHVGLFAAEGNIATIPHLTGEQLRSYRIPIPSNGHELTARTTKQITHIKEIDASLKRAQELLEERRRALITAAVTGQFDVSTASGRGIED